MPKEKINPSYPQEGPSLHMEIGWDRDMDVRIGIVADDGHHLIDALYGDQLAMEEIERIFTNLLKQCGYVVIVDPDSATEVRDESLGRIILDAVTGSTPYGNGIWIHPGRRELNDLVRLTRKARDQAFGADA